MSAVNTSTQALPEVAPRRDFAKLTPTRTQPIPALQLEKERTLSIIVPIHNAKPKVHSFLLAVDRVAQDFKPEVIFVDSGDDDTAEYLDKIRGRFPFEIRRVSQDPIEDPPDFAVSALVGFMSARLEWMCVARADSTSFSRNFATLLLEGTTGYTDLVLGSRRYQGRITRSVFLKLISFGAKLFLPKHLNELSDPLTSVFIVRRSSLFLKRMSPAGSRVLPEILKRFPYLEVQELPMEVLKSSSDDFNPSWREDISAFFSLLRSRQSKR